MLLVYEICAWKLEPVFINDELKRNQVVMFVYDPNFGNYDELGCFSCS